MSQLPARIEYLAADDQVMVDASGAVLQFPYTGPSKWEPELEQLARTASLHPKPTPAYVRAVGVDDVEMKRITVAASRGHVARSARSFSACRADPN